MKSVHRARANIFDLQPLEVRRFLTTASVSSGLLTINGTAGGETITVNQFNSTSVSVTGVSGSFSRASFTRIFVNAGGGNDTILISGNLGSVQTTISGGNGNDFITGGGGPDRISGDAGFDTANYSGRTSAVKVDLDGNADDGGSGGGEGDNVITEEVIGGSGNDTFTGNSGANFLAGGAGGDTLTGGSGNDELVGSTGIDRHLGQSGDDAIYAKNSDRDTVNGGTNSDGTVDFDLAEVDGIDVPALTDGSRGPAALGVGSVEVGGNPAALDTTYGGNDTGTNAGPPAWNGINAATVDSLGRVVLVGYQFRDHNGDFSADFAVTRYNADGTWDEDFGEQFVDFGSGNGYSDDDIAYGVTTDADDNVVVVGSSRASTQFSFDQDVAVVRFAADGTFDTDFGFQRFDVTRSGDSLPGNVDDVAQDVVVQADGKIVVVGAYDIFGGDSDVLVLRLDETGGLDSGFGGEGTGMVTFDIDATYEQASSVALQTLAGDPAGTQRIVVGGTFGGDFLVARFSGDGTLDDTFATGGYLSFDVNEGSADVLNDIAVNALNEIVAVGQTYFPIGFATQPTPNFGARGVFAGIAADGSEFVTQFPSDTEVSYNAVAFDDAGNAVVAGSDGEDFLLTRYTAQFEQDGSFNDGELVFTDITPPDTTPQYRDVALGVAVVDGKIVVGGYSAADVEGPVLTSVARYGSAGFEVEGFLDFDDVQDDRGGNRSAAATFYLKSTHLDDGGNAFVELTNNNDVVTLTLVQDEDGNDQVSLTYGDLVLYYDTTTTSITIDGKNGHDVIVADDDVPIRLFIFGGNGNDQLAGGGANDRINGGAGNDTVGGNDGHDVIVADSGLDTVSGNAGNDILIGGSASDSLNGGADEDILIGGTTAYDNNSAALESLSAEWRRDDITNAERITHLRNGGGLNGTNRLRVSGGATVFDDNAGDRYTGGVDRDWFFRKNTGGANTRDQILDNVTGEEVDNF